MALELAKSERVHVCVDECAGSLVGADDRRSWRDRLATLVFFFDPRLLASMGRVLRRPVAGLEIKCDDGSGAGADAMSAAPSEVSLEH